MEPQANDPTIDRPGLDSPPPSTAGRPARTWGLALVAATLAGVGSWLAGEAAWNYFVPKENLVRAMGMALNAPKFEDRASAERKNASMANGLLGALLGMALGLAGGLARRSPKAALASGLFGAVIGLGAGVGASEAILPYYFQQLDRDAEALARDLMLPLLVHSGIWSAIGAAGGAAFGLGLGLRKQVAAVALAGLIGGALGAVAYEIIGALVFPASRTAEPLATYWAPRLVGKLTVALLTTALAVLAATTPLSKKPARA